MNWENINSSSEQSNIQPSQTNLHTYMEEEQNELNEIIQLKKFKDPIKDIERQTKLTLLKNFGDLLRANNINDMLNTVLTEDCEFFLFSSTGRTPVQYCLHPSDLHKLYEGIQIQERIVRKTYIDLEKGTAIQICNFRILYEGEENPVNEVVSEMFIFKNNKISKYRAFAGKMTAAHGDSDPFQSTTKDRALAVVTQVNYALAGKPDFEKATTLFHNNIKYKIWSWDSQKCYILEKHNFAEMLQNNIQENFVIKSIVPYEVYTEAKVAVGTYAYHLEGRTGDCANKKYIWLTTCFYVLDEDYKIVKVSQQGDLHLEGQVKPQFEVYAREKLIKKIESFFMDVPTMDLFYRDVFGLQCISYAFGPEWAPNIGFYQGTTMIDRVLEWSQRKGSIASGMKLVESLVDCCDSSYDVVVSLHCFQITSHYPGYKYNNTEIDIIILSIIQFEHGKIVKGYSFLTEVPQPLPSPFNDSSFEGANIKPKSTFL